MGGGSRAGDVRQRIIESLRDSEGMSGMEVAERVGVSRLTMTKYLHVLAAEGTLRRRKVGSGTLWFLEPGQESFSFPDDYFRAAEMYRDHIAGCSADAHSLVRNCLRSGASGSRLVLEVVEPALGAVKEMYEEGKIGSAERGLMNHMVYESLQIVSLMPVNMDGKRCAMVVAADPGSAGIAEAASAAYRAEGWSVWHLGDMSGAADVLFDTDFERLLGRVWRQGPGILVVSIFAGTPEGLGFFAGSMGPARKKHGRMRLVLCGPVPEGGGPACDLAAGGLGEVLQWSATVSGA